MNAELNASDAHQPEAVNAASPFDKPGADIILRSKDLVDFRVRKAILQEASPFFEDLFKLPQPSLEDMELNGDTSRDGLPIILMSEDSATIDKLLRICYPTRNPQIATFDELRLLLDAARKYMMDEALETLKERLCAFAEDAPIQAYAIALQYKLEREARETAKCFLNYSVDNIYAPELEEITGGAYHRILDYHRRCSKAASEVVKAFRWIDPSNNWTFFQCSNYSCNPHTMQYYLRGEVLRTPRTWWLQWMERSGERLKTRPSSKAISAPDWADEALKQAMGCHYCKTYALEHIRAFTIVFAKEIDRVTAQIELEVKM